MSTQVDPRWNVLWEAVAPSVESYRQRVFQHAQESGSPLCCALTGKVLSLATSEVAYRQPNTFQHLAESFLETTRGRLTEAGLRRWQKWHWQRADLTLIYREPEPEADWLPGDGVIPNWRLTALNLQFRQRVRDDMAALGYTRSTIY
jgi:hypothetical protein